ncbi:MAG: DUF192 domain-containing protein [Pseudobdellovibrio sp.]
MALRLKFLIVTALSLFSISLFAEVAPHFDREKIEFSFNGQKKEVSVEMALNSVQHQYGLMNRTKLAADNGMIFIFEDEQIRDFWMKNTLIDLDIAYLNKDKKIIDIQTMKAVTSILQTDLPSYPSKGPAQYAVEMNAGWFKKNKFGIGTLMKVLPGPTSKKSK